MTRWLAAAIASVSFGGGAFAEPANLAQPSAGTTYFNRPGATLSVHDEELKACILKAQESFHGPPVDIIGGIVGATMVGGQGEFIRRVGIENCMVVRGWRVVRISEQDKGLERLKAAELAPLLAPLVGAEKPGGVVRAWNNDAVLTDTVREKMPGYFVGRSLSLQVLTLDKAFAADLAAVRHPEHGPFGKDVIRKPTPPEVLDTTPTDSAVVIVTTRGRAPVKHVGLSLRRAGPDPYLKASNDGRPESFYAGPEVRGRKGGGAAEQTRAFIIPPGRWHVFSNGGLHTYCLGAPFFEVKAGEVIYAGLFDFSSDTLIPDMSVGPAIAYLSAAPATLAKLQPAGWTNGHTRGCGEGGFTGYALEFPDFPYADGYRKAGSAG